jgi:hypothetical protein
MGKFPIPTCPKPDNFLPQPIVKGYERSSPRRARMVPRQGLRSWLTVCALDKGARSPEVSPGKLSTTLACS